MKLLKYEKSPINDCSSLRETKGLEYWRILGDRRAPTSLSGTDAVCPVRGRWPGDSSRQIEKSAMGSRPCPISCRRAEAYVH